MSKNYYDIMLGLAGVCQAAHLVHNLAHQGYCHEVAFKASLRSLLEINPISTLGVFGNNESNLQLGLETVISLLKNKTRQNIATELMRYTLNLMMLERKLSSNKLAQYDLIQRIRHLDRQLEYYELESDVFINIMASIYIDIISPLATRIQVTGSPELLRNPQLQSKIRAILLAGIRAAVLWQQVGGGRLQLIFSRQRILHEAKNILSKLGI